MAKKAAASKTFLGLDLSLTGTGIFVLRGAIMRWREIATKPADFAHSLVRVEYIANEVVDYVNKFKPDFIVVEDYFTGRNPRAIIQLCELGTIVRYKLLKSGHPLLVVAPTQLKKFVLGKGSGPKELILKGVFKKWGVDVNSNNLADACTLAYLARAIYNEQHGIPQTLLKYEEDVVKKIMSTRQVLTAMGETPKPLARKKKA